MISSYPVHSAEWCVLMYCPEIEVEGQTCIKRWYINDWDTI